MSAHVKIRTRSPLPTIAATAALLAPAAIALGDASLTKLSDSVVDANALLLASSGQWGRAINGQAFQVEPLISYNGYQYVAWYINDSDMSVMLARRTIAGSDAGAWDIIDTGSNFTRGDNDWDVHNVISIGLSRDDGRLHLSWDHHVHNLRYRVSVPGVGTDNPDAWGSGMFSAERNYLGAPGDVPPMTYPEFINTPSGGLLFAFRDNHSGFGDYRLSTYENGAWGPSRVVIGKAGSYTDALGTSPGRNGYPDGFVYGPDGKLHVTWVWRESTGGANHDINYAYSEDGGVTWKNNAGVVVADTSVGNALTINDPGLVIKELDRRQSLYNTTGLTVDTAGRVHLLTVHRRQEAGYEWQPGDGVWEPLDTAYYHYFRDPKSGDWSERRLPVDLPVGTRPEIGHDAHDNVFAVYTTRDESAGDYKYSAGDLVIARATAANGYADWTILHVEKLDSGVGFISEPRIDQRRLLEDGILSIFVQEDAPSIPGRTGTRLHVLEFNVAPEPASASVGLIGLGALAARWRR